MNSLVDGEAWAIENGEPHWPLITDPVTREVRPCRCGKVFRADGIDYRHGRPLRIEDLLADLVDPDALTRIIVSPEAVKTAAPTDPIGDLMRYAARLRSQRPPPEVIAGDAEVVRTMFERAGILPSPAPHPAPDHLFGIPIRVDPDMPPDMMRIGDRWFILPS